MEIGAVDRVFSRPIRVGHAVVCDNRRHVSRHYGRPCVSDGWAFNRDAELPLPSNAAEGERAICLGRYGIRNVRRVLRCSSDEESIGRLPYDFALSNRIKPLIEILAGIPSIVLGFLGWVALAPLIQELGAPTGLTAFTGALILAYMSLPTIISVSEDALYAVPKEYRDGALALGATKWQMIWRVMLPAANSGLAIAVMLGIGRAIGERKCALGTGELASSPHRGALFLPNYRAE